MALSDRDWLVALTVFHTLALVIPGAIAWAWEAWHKKDNQGVSPFGSGTPPLVESSPAQAAAAA